MQDAETQKIVDRLRSEFIHSVRDALDDITERLDSGRDLDETATMRAAHSIKGQGSTFGFPTVTALAHRLETWLQRDETASRAKAAIAHAAAMRDILDRGVDPSPAEADALFAGLDATCAAAGDPPRIAVIVTPSNTAAQLLTAALESADFAAVRVADAFEGLGVAARMKPEVVILARDFGVVGAVEIMAAAAAIAALRDTPFIVLTATAGGPTTSADPLRPFGVVMLDQTLPESLAAVLRRLPKAA
ncbi:MAG: Hpt domain-containing protein [Pseudomonadota bacterium]